MQGRPYAIETSFPSWLQLSLQACEPDRTWTVVNCGGVSYASYRLAPIMRELLAYEPDMFILYTGHNEFLEDRTYSHVKRAPRPLAAMHRWLTHLRTYNALRSAWIRVRSPRANRPPDKLTRLPAEVDARLDYRGGLDGYHRDDAWRKAIIEHFEFNLRRMISMANRAGVPIVLVNPVSNLKDCPPFKFANRDSISADEKAQFDSLWERAKQADRSVDDRIAILRQAVALDQRHAGVLYHLGKCYQDHHQLQEAKRQLGSTKTKTYVLCAFSHRWRK